MTFYTTVKSNLIIHAVNAFVRVVGFMARAGVRLRTKRDIAGSLYVIVSTRNLSDERQQARLLDAGRRQVVFSTLAGYVAVSEVIFVLF